MSGEKLSTNREKEFSPEIEKTGAERREQLQEDIERQIEAEPNRNPEVALQDALEHSVEAKENRNPIDTDPSKLGAEKYQGAPSKDEREDSFNHTMNEVRTHMSPVSRTFSKVIHNKVVEKVSDVAGNTVVRPNAVLSGAVLAFVATLVVYIVARNLGYPLSGFETIGAFTFGWILGVVFDFLRNMITGKSS